MPVRLMTNNLIRLSASSISPRKTFFYLPEPSKAD